MKTFYVKNPLSEEDVQGKFKSPDMIIPFNLSNGGGHVKFKSGETKGPLPEKEALFFAGKIAERVLICRGVIRNETNMLRVANEVLKTNDGEEVVFNTNAPVKEEKEIVDMSESLVNQALAEVVMEESQLEEGETKVKAKKAKPSFE